MVAKTIFLLLLLSVAATALDDDEPACVATEDCCKADSSGKACVFGRRLRRGGDLDECLDEEYEVQFYLDDVKGKGNVHAFLLGSPFEPASKCSSILIEEYIDDLETREKVQGVFLLEQSFVGKLQPFLSAETTWTFLLGHILEAFDDYKPKSNRFDIVKNNCTCLPLRLLRALGVRFTNESVTFGVQALTGYPQLIDAVKKSGSYKELYEKGQPPATEDDLIQGLVEFSLAKCGGYEAV